MVFTPGDNFFAFVQRYRKTVCLTAIKLFLSAYIFTLVVYQNQLRSPAFSGGFFYGNLAGRHLRANYYL